MFDTYLQFLVLELHKFLSWSPTLGSEAVLLSNHAPRTSVLNVTWGVETPWECGAPDFCREMKTVHAVEK